MVSALTPIPPIGGVIASNLVAKQRRKVRFMYREPPDDPNDSGWRFFCGDEDQAYADDPSNFALYNPSTIVEIDASILPHLLTPPPCAFERDTTDQPFRKSVDFRFAPEE